VGLEDGGFGLAAWSSVPKQLELLLALLGLALLRTSTTPATLTPVMPSSRKTREALHFLVDHFADVIRELCAKHCWDESRHPGVTVISPLPAKGGPAPFQEDTTPVDCLNKGLERIDAVTKCNAWHSGI
jgi:hypothetical protein